MTESEFMANRNFRDRVFNLENGLVLITGQIVIAADASVSSVVGKGFTAAKTATGAYTITLNDVYASFLSGEATLLAATAVDLVPQFVSEAVASTKLVVIKTLAAATATDPSAVCRILFSLKLKNSSV